MVLASWVWSDTDPISTIFAGRRSETEQNLTVAHVLAFLVGISSVTTALLMFVSLLASLAALLFSMPLFVVFAPMFVVTVLGALLTVVMVMAPLGLILLCAAAPSFCIVTCQGKSSEDKELGVSRNFMKSSALMIAAFSIYFAVVFGTFYDKPECWVPTVKLSFNFYNPYHYLKSIQIAIVLPKSFELSIPLRNSYMLSLLALLAEFVSSVLVILIQALTKKDTWVRLLQTRVCCSASSNHQPEERVTKSVAKAVV
jgi:hypothetical protein